MKISLVSVPVKDPVRAHEIYTQTLGFISKEYDPEASLAIVTSAEDPEGTAILLEPCEGSFAERYQQSAYEANLPIMGLKAENVTAQMQCLKAAGIVLRPELDNPKWGIENVFEDGCGNLLMIEPSSSS